MSAFRIAFASRARDDLHRRARWWRENRPLNPGLFDEEITEGLGLLCTAPFAGEICPYLKAPDIRRRLLKRTRHYIYYRVDQARELVEIVAIRHTSRGSGPAL